MKNSMRFISMVVLFFSITSVMAQETSILDELQDLYENVTKSEIQSRAEATGTPLKFLRTFVPYYYSLVDNMVKNDDYTLFTQLKKYDGWCIGDAHLENFGSILIADGSALFTVNDIDDAGPCMIAADFLRLIVSIKLSKYDSLVDIDEVIEAYREGLEKENFLESEIANKLVNKSEKNGFYVKEKDLTEDGLGIKRKSDMQSVSSAVKKSLVAEIKRILGAKAQVLDAVKVIRTEGGSGGLNRFQVLVELGEDTPVLFEFKELSAPGVKPLSGSTYIPVLKTRIQRTLELEHGGKPHPYYGYAEVDGIQMLLRPKTEGQQGVEITDVEEYDIPSLLRDEARVIGRIHRTSAKNTLAYRNAVRNTDNEQWKAPARDIKRYIKEAFESMQSEAEACNRTFKR